MQCARIAASALKLFTSKVFERAGLAPDDACTVADALVWANLRGVDSHGVRRIPSYLEYMKSGHMKLRPDIRVLRETPAIVAVDADRAAGPVITVRVMRDVVGKAKQVGIGWGLVRNLTHQGALGYYAELAADMGMVGIVNVCGTPVMAPHGAKAPGVHNSPLAIGVPAGKERPLLLDMAHSVAAGGRIKHAQDSGASIPAGWALDRDGNPTQDPASAAILLPLGGPKGSGLAMVFECLSSVMAGNPLLSVAIPRMLAGESRYHAQNGIVAAIDIGAFTDAGLFRARVEELIAAVKSLPRAHPDAEILVPGERGYRTHDERAANGIPLPPGTAGRLQEVAQRMGVPFPHDD